MARQLSFKESDFDLRREELVAYLKEQPQFKDFNYDGSNISTLVDLLAYNSMMQSFQKNIELNERFSDSARLPRSVASHAKTFNYTPKSMTSSYAVLEVELITNQTSPFLVTPSRLEFVSNSIRGTETFSFWSDSNLTFIRENGQYRKIITVREGIYKTEVFYVREPEEIYTMTRDDVDISSFEVVVEDPNGNLTSFTRSNNLIDVTNESPVYFIQTSDLERYEIYFGSGNFGVQPIRGSKIYATYRRTIGPKANGVNAFISPREGLPEGTSMRIRSVIAGASGGTERESLESVKRNAPAAMRTRGRAVTEDDYIQLLKDEFPYIQSVSAIGGENLDPPEYGKVVLIIDIAGMDGVSEVISQEIKRFIDKKSPLTAKPIVRPAHFMYLEVDTVVKYNNLNTTKTVSAVQASVLESILGYSSVHLGDFNTTFRLSKLSKIIDESDSSIVSSITKTRPVIDLNFVVGLNTFRVDFGGRIIPTADYAIRSTALPGSGGHSMPVPMASRDEVKPAVISSTFLIRNTSCYIVDDGYGKLNVVRDSGGRNIIVVPSVGSVDYNTGVVNLNKLQMDTGGQLKIYANMADVDVSAPLGYILRVRPEDVWVEVEIDNVP